jgi:site-specific DNA-methyltransferase (adenine-specific)
MIKLFNGDCLEELKNLPDRCIDLFLLDLPYNCTECEWDKDIIDLNKMWVQIKRTIKLNSLVVFFCTVKFGNTLINSNPQWFKYDLIWEKQKSVGFLSANKSPLRSHEQIYIFGCNKNDDINIEFNKDLRKYAGQLRNHINENRTSINGKMGDQSSQHFIDAFKNTQFSIPTLESYTKLTQIYKLDELDYYIKYEDLKEQYEREIKEKIPLKTYNPQMTKGKPYKTQGGDFVEIYNAVSVDKINTGERFPKSVLKFGHDKVKHHPTQKPILLLEYLIKTYSNEGDTICDFTMGSGSTGVAAKNLNRNFIGCEKNKTYFKIAEKRINID